MTSVSEIKQAIMGITASEYAGLMERLDELEEDPWDRQINENVKAGRLSSLQEEALEAKAIGALTYL